MLVTGVVAAGALSVALLLPRHLLPGLCFVMALGVPVAALLGWCWRRSRGVRIVLCGMLALSAVLLVQALLRGQLPPSLARHLLLQAAAGVVTLMVFLLVQACRTRWKKNRSSFVVRMTVLVLLTLGCAAGALLAIHRAEGDDPRLLAMIVSGVCGVLSVLRRVVHHVAGRARTWPGFVTP
ncbi:MAG: hypothetical protein PBU97_21325 [Stenotrophomonas maltophilia]